jgi:Uma2 family endonuclease
MSDLAFQNEEYKQVYKTEIHDGKIVMQAASPGMRHFEVVSNLYKLFQKHLTGKKCRVFFDSVDVILSKENRFVPDIMVVCDKNKITEKGISGAPDLVVEVISKSTMKADRIHKKNTYERYGVKEFWLVDTAIQSIEMHKLAEDGKFVLHDLHSVVDDDTLEDMSEAEKAAVTYEFRPVLFPDMLIKVAEVFEQSVW